MKLVELVRRIFHEEVTAYTNVIQLSQRNYNVLIDQDDQLTVDEKKQFKGVQFFRHPKATNLILSVHPRLNDMQIQVVRDKIINLSNDIVNAKDFYKVLEESPTVKPEEKPKPTPVDVKKSDDKDGSGSSPVN